jgi:hypothetical protein
MSTATSSRVYLRKKHLRIRYGWESDKSVDRAVKNGQLPEPDTYNGRFPLWLESRLDAHDDARRERAIEEGRASGDAARAALRNRRDRDAAAAE